MPIIAASKDYHEGRKPMTAARYVTYNLDSAAVGHLMKADVRLSGLITATGSYTLELRDDHFLGLARAVVGQQLSVAAARSIWGRLESQPSLLTPEGLASGDVQTLTSAGVSMAKASCLTAIAQAVTDRVLNFDEFHQLTNEAIVERLSSFKGIGRWTAEMYLIFSLGREDVMSVGDAGLRRAAGLLVSRSRGPMEPEELAEFAAGWAPYRSIASLYLWRGLDSRLLTEA